MKLTNETKTGIFVLICLAALLGLLMKVGNFTFFKKGYVLRTRFHFTGGVKANSPVRLSGVDVGEVRDIRLLNEGSNTLAEVDLWLERDAKVRRDSTATVSTLGLMGEKYIEIQVGASPEFASPNDLLTGEDPARLEDLIDIGKQVANDISKVANDVDDVVQHNRPKIDSIFDNLEETSENFNDFSQDVKYHPWKVLAKGKETPKEQMLKDRQVRHVERERTRSQQQLKAPIDATIETAVVATTSDNTPVRKNFARKT